MPGVHDGNDIEDTTKHWLACRPRQTFYFGLLCGCIGVLIDIDHILCAYLGLGTWKPEASEYGCRLLHGYILPVAWYLCCIAVALLLGSIVYLVYDTFRTTP